MSAKTAKKITENIRTRNCTSAEVTYLEDLFSGVSGWGAQLCCCSWRTWPEKSDKQWSFYTSLEKFRRKYTTLTAEWRSISAIWKNGSGLAPKEEPSWYKILNPIISENDESLLLAGRTEDLSFNLQNDSVDGDFESQLTDVNLKTFQKSDGESLNEEGEQNVIWRAPRKPPLMVTKNGSCSWQKKKCCSIAKLSPFKNF